MASWERLSNFKFLHSFEYKVVYLLDWFPHKNTEPRLPYYLTYVKG